MVLLHEQTHTSRTKETWMMREVLEEQNRIKLHALNKSMSRFLTFHFSLALCIVSVSTYYNWFIGYDLF